MKERRRAKRVTEYIPISYRIPPSPRISHFLTRDISTSGVRFFIGEYVNKSSIIVLTITLKKIPFSFQVQSQVCWITKDPSGDRYEVGVEFQNIPKEAEENLDLYIRKYVKV